MRPLSFAGLGCLIALAVALGQAQQPSDVSRPAMVNYARPRGPAYLLKPYFAPSVPENMGTNSARLEALIKQGKMRLSVADALSLAIENNLDLVVASFDLATAQTDLLRAKAGGATRGVAGTFQSGSLFSGALGAGVGGGGGAGGGAGGASGGGGAFSVGGGGLDPSVNFGFGWNQNTVPLGITILQGVPVVTTHTATYSYSVGQAFTTGTSFGLFLFGQRQSTTGLNSVFNPQVPTQMAVGFNQPLLNGFGRRVNARFIRIAVNEVRFADFSFQQQMMTTVAKVLGLYWDLVAGREHVAAAGHALELAKKTLEDTRKEVRLGVIARFEEVRARAEVARYEEALVRARTESEQLQEQLKTVISKQVETDLAAAEVVPSAELPEPERNDVVPIKEALQVAVLSRPEVEQARLNLRNQEITIKATRNALLPALGVFATYAPQGLSGNRVIRGTNGQVVRVEPGGLGQSLSQTLGNQYPDYSVGFSLSLPLRNRAAQADHARAVLEERQLEAKLQAQINAVQEEVRRALIGVAEARVQIGAARNSLVAERETLEGEQKKFQLGESDIFHVAQAERDLAAAEDAEVTARAAYAKALLQFEAATGTVLERNHIEISKAGATAAPGRFSPGR